MPIVDPFASFDPSPYQTTPQLPLQTLVILSNALSKRMPQGAPPYVKDAEDEMRTTAIEAEQAMVVRLRETNEVGLAADLALDSAMDGLFVLTRDRLRGWERYKRPGLDFLLEDPEYEIEFEAIRDKANRAADLLTKLFGDGSLPMLSRPFPEQAQLMANVLRLIKEDDHEDELLELAGDELLPLIRRVYAEYADMVDRRTDEESASRANLRIMRNKLQRRIVNYASLVLTMLKESKPQTLTVVEAALAPMVNMRPARASGSEQADQAANADEQAQLAEVLANADQPEAEAEG